MKYVVRKKSGKTNFYYVDSKGRKITDKKIIEYVTHLPIPPMYHDVKIYLNSKKVIAIGTDDAGRKQYIYNPDHVKKMTKKKYNSMVSVGKVMPKINRLIDKNLRLKTYTKEKLIATVLKIMLICNFRIGNGKYKELYNSYGISTITKKHITVSPNSVHIKYVGKKGVNNECTVKDPIIVGIIKYLYKKRKINDVFFGVSSNDVNDFLKQFGNVTTKNLRTWNANVIYLGFLRKIILENPQMDSVAKRKKLSTLAITKTAESLHHTTAICKKSYINNAIINLFVDDPVMFVRYAKKYTKPEDLFIHLSKKL